MRLVLVACLLVPTVAAAGPEPTFEVLDRGDAVEVIAHDVKAARTAVIPQRSRLEVAVIGYPRARPLVPRDRGVKVVELADDAPRVLTVKLPLERADVKRLARHAQAIQVGNDLHLLFPRTVPADDATVTLPEPTLPAALANKLSVVGPTLPPPPSKPSLEGGRKPLPEPAKLDAAPSPPPAVAPKPESSKPFLDQSERSSNLSLYAILGLSAIGIGIWLVRRRRSAREPASSIDVIAQRSLGTKAKVVWLAAGGREMVIAVTPQQVRMLGQWRKGEQTTQQPLPEASLVRTATKNPPAPSSSVSGILKLRERVPAASQHTWGEPLHEDIATGDLDADALWAKEILAATGSRR